MECTKRPVLVFTDEHKTEMQGEAHFLGFGCDYAEFDKGIAMFTTAIVEWRDGTVTMVPPIFIKFLDNQPIQNQTEGCHVD